MAQPERYIRHITLTTGESRRVARNEVKHETFNELRRMLTAALAERGKLVATPGFPECAITATPIGRALLATVWGTNAELYTWGRARVPLMTIGMAAHQHGGEQLWRVLHEERPCEVCTSIKHIPTAPWIAVRPELGLTRSRDAGEWLEQFAHAAAWAWIESSSEENRCAPKLELAPEAL